MIAFLIIALAGLLSGFAFRVRRPHRSTPPRRRGPFSFAWCSGCGANLVQSDAPIEFVGTHEVYLKCDLCGAPNQILLPTAVTSKDARP